MSAVRFGACAALVLPQALAALQSEPQIDLSSTLVMGDKAVMMLAPKSIADSVEHAEWSPTGKYVVYTQHARLTAQDMIAAIMGNPVPNAQRFATQQLFAWNGATGKSVKLGTVPIGRLNGFWFAGDETFAISEPIFRDESQQVGIGVKLQLINPATGSARSVAFPVDGFASGFYPNQEAPLVATVVMKLRGSTSVVVFDSQGTVRMRSTLPPNLHIGHVLWLKGSEALTSIATDLNDRGRLPTLLIDSRTGDFREVNANQVPERQLTPEHSRLLDTRLVARVNKSSLVFSTNSTVSSATLMIEKPRSWQSAGSSDVAANVERPIVRFDPEKPDSAFIGTHIDQAEVSPKQNALLYVQNGVLLVRELAALPLDAYKRMRDSAQRAEAISKAKQMGLGMLMYAADYDDVLPTGFDPNAVAPYLKNFQVMEGFVYTFGGGNLAKVETVANTEMGYVPGPGGRAVVYLDGHVKWIADPPRRPV